MTLTVSWIAELEIALAEHEFECTERDCDQAEQIRFEIDAEATVQAVHRPDGRTFPRLVFHVIRLNPVKRRRRAEAPLQLALF